ncbi:AtpZ/AtpI family protein [Mucilaginibacter sp. BJC16-A38]|uniref:AtpZ/AtpI family protein n=1 Tax=Mucilaginibacter phenanthrenivorans TaxID=1234842 RepID=UPI002157CF8D|nr:AtpZ/AtpI family protein [Mucilaginibacter phenanthrenivorans]MCR8558669.1 AtpZ/AtpI family protein [Mucilaginibacter phenanthrenivorans]
MAKDEQKQENGNEKPANNYIKFTGMGFQMIATIGLFTYAGYKIDESAHHATKWVTAVLSLVGVFVSLYLVIRSVKN